jgi:hypothetical protein
MNDRQTYQQLIGDFVLPRVFDAHAHAHFTVYTMSVTAIHDRPAPFRRLPVTINGSQHRST